MPKVFTSITQKTGEIGENIAVKFLVKHDFLILNRNYTKKWGEIDIVSEKNDKLYFIEVKSISRDISDIRDMLKNKVIPAEAKALASRRETNDNYNPEDNMHPWKLKRLSRTIQTYLLSEKIPDEKEWQVDLLVVFLDIKNKKAKVKVVSDIIL
ncbi:YraN family protein [Patescibacteria group bacterium]|nr:YraN family protein [Patescibacteria group bacterium]